MKNFLGIIGKMSESSGYDAGVQIHRDLSPEEYERFSEAQKILSLFIRNVQLYKVVLWNYEDYKNLISYYTTAYLDKDRNRFSDNYLDINRGVNNFLSSFRMYVDHMETYLKRHSLQRDNAIKFNSYLSAAYDQSFSYRFMYKLRNYAQHCNLPIDHIQFSEKTDSTETGGVSYKIEIGCTKLLSQEFNWGTLKNEIESLDKPVIIEPHLQNLIEILININEKFTLDETNSIQGHIVFIKNLFEEIPHTNGTRCVLSDYQVTYDNDGIRTFAFDIYRILINLINAILNKDMTKILSLANNDNQDSI